MIGIRCNWPAAQLVACGLVACGGPEIRQPAAATPAAYLSLVEKTPYTRMFERGREWTWQLERGDGSWPDDEEHQKPLVEHSTREIVTCRTTDVREVQRALAARFECVPDDLERRWWPTTWIATSKGLYMTGDLFPAEWERRVAELKDDNMLPMVLAAHPRKQREQKDFDEAGWTREVTHVADAWCVYDTAGAELDRHDMQLCFDAERGLVSGGGLDVDGNGRHFTAFAFGDAPSLSDLW